MKPNATTLHVIKIDAPPVRKERSTGGNGRSLEGRPSHKARNARSNSGKHKTGKKKVMMSTPIFLADTPDLGLLLPLGVSLLSSVVGIWALSFSFRCGFRRNVGGLEEKEVVCFKPLNGWMPGEAEADRSETETPLLDRLLPGPKPREPAPLPTFEALTLTSFIPHRLCGTPVNKVSAFSI